MMTEERLPSEHNEEVNLLETNMIVRFFWNILFACFYPIIITFSLLVSALVFIISFSANLIFKIFRR